VAVVRRCRDADLDKVQATLALAFADYPPLRWMIQADGYEERLHEIVGLTTAGYGLERREIWVSDDVASVAVWVSPEQRAMNEGLGEIYTRIFAAQGERSEYAMRSYAVWESARPEEPHWYLQTLGTHPGRQGEGLGRLVCAPVLDRLDADAAPAFVDTSGAENVRFYESLGFEVIDEWDMPDGGPHGWAMWRTPR
jgi:ribosomal protein S18 acetylase RimI-like enzyme